MVPTFSPGPWAGYGENRFLQLKSIFGNGSNGRDIRVSFGRRSDDEALDFAHVCLVALAAMPATAPAAMDISPAGVVLDGAGRELTMGGVAAENMPCRIANRDQADAGADGAAGDGHPRAARRGALDLIGDVVDYVPVEEGPRTETDVLDAA